MGSSLPEGIQIAEGYNLKDEMPSSFGLAYEYRQPTSHTFNQFNVNGQQQKELLSNEEYKGAIACLSPDGGTVYYAKEHLFAKNLFTGETQKLEEFSRESPFNRICSLYCSSDNRTLYFTQTTNPPVGGSPIRLSRISTSGTGFRVLYQDPPEGRLFVEAVFCWQHDFVLFMKTFNSNPMDGFEFCRVDLESSERYCKGNFSFISFDLAIHPHGKQVAWSDFHNEIYLYSLESGEIQTLLSSGSKPAWSPDGKTLSFMKRKNCLSLLDIESGKVQDVIWFKNSYLSRNSEGGLATQPLWSPDGKMLWFMLTQKRKRPLPRNLTEAFRRLKQSLPRFDFANPRGPTLYFRSRSHSLHQMGVLDLTSKQVILNPPVISLGSFFRNSIHWIPLHEEG